MPDPDPQSVLDEIYDLAAARFEDGLAVDLDAILGGRQDLRSEAEEVVRLARRLVFGPGDAIPGAPGYAILRELGRGGMGAVYLARQERLARQVALKILPAFATLSPRARTRFLAEAHAIARLRHPNIVAIYDVIESDGVLAYAMEWVDGASLASVLERLPPAESEPSLATVRIALEAPDGTIPDSSYPVFIARLGIAIARALVAVHAGGLVHRDVKPSNILLRSDGTPLLSDFGLVRETDTTVVTQQGQFAGTAMYASPEQLRGEHDRVDARSDVYSLGATLYHSLARRDPFEPGPPVKMLHQIEGGAGARLRRVAPRAPRDLETIIAKAMDADPSRRYQSADEMADDLERMLNLQPIRARRTGVVGRSLRLMRRNRRVLVGGLAGATLAGAGTLVLLAMLIVTPRWSRAEHRSAQLSLFQVLQADDLAVVASGAARAPNPDSKRALIEAALPHYDAAVRWSPFDRALRRERATVRAALTIARTLSDGSPALNEGTGGGVYFDSGLPPLTRAYAHAWTDRRAQPDIIIPADASPEDLRSLGLLAFLCRDVTVAIDAWSRLDPIAEPDPFIDASLGELHLAREEVGPAMARLLSAVRAYGDVRFLLVELADAALMAGDVDACARWLNHAAPLDQEDPYSIFDRVRADFHATRCLMQVNAAAEARARGDDLGARIHEARANDLEFLAEIGSSSGERPLIPVGETPVFLAMIGPDDRRDSKRVRDDMNRPVKGYTYYADYRQNPTARDHYARFLIARRRLRDAINVYAALLEIRSNDPRWHERFTRAADLWWAEQDAEARVRLMWGALNGETWFVGMLRNYEGCREALVSATHADRSGQYAHRGARADRVFRLQTGGHGSLAVTRTPTFLGPHPWPLAAAVGTTSIHPHREDPQQKDPSPIDGFVAATPPELASSIERLTLSEVGARMEVSNMSFWTSVRRSPPCVSWWCLGAWTCGGSRAWSRLAVGVAIVLTGRSLQADTIVYDPSLRTLPEAQGFTFNAPKDDHAPDPGASTGVLKQGPTISNCGPGYQYWERSDVPIDLTRGARLEVFLRVISSSYECADECQDPFAKAGYYLIIADAEQRHVMVGIASDRVFMYAGERVDCNEGYELIDTTGDLPLHYIVQISGGIARLIIDGRQSQQVTLAGPIAWEPANRVAFGDASHLGTSQTELHYLSYTNCLADLAEPYGNLNIFDFLAFQTLFSREDPRADLAPPFGVFNAFDFLAFQTAFGEGCE